jgi:AcrR family transcriptional regulator
MPRELREEQVLQAATEEFGRAGYSAASLAEIGRQAGVSKAMVLSYFRSKDDLFAVCVQRVGSRLAEHVAPVLLVPAPTGVLAEATIVAMLTALADRPSDWNLLVDPSVPRQGVARDAAREARALIGGQAAQGVGLLEDLDLVNDPDDVEVLTAIWMHTVSAVLGWWSEHPDRSVEEMSSRFHRLLGVLQPRPAS